MAGLGALAWIFWPGVSQQLGRNSASHSLSELKPEGENAYQMVTGESPEDDRAQWDALYSTRGYVFGKEPAEFLRTQIDLLPVGTALDIAMGEGRNAVFLAKKGFNVDGVDISEVAIRKAKLLARENGVSINTIIADLNRYKITPESYEVIVNINYLQRSLVSQMKIGLKPGGVVVFESQTIEQLQNPGGQNIPRDYLLEPGELRRLFSDFEVLHYSESNDGQDALASLIARKPL